MSNPSKQKGTSWETAIVEWLKGRRFKARRLALSGALDQGDVEVWSHNGHYVYVVEAKNARQVRLTEWWAQAEQEAKNYDAAHEPLFPPIPVLWIHRPGKASPGEGLVIMKAADFFRATDE